MATNNEIASFEDFKFNVGDMVRVIAERVTTDRMIRAVGTTAALSAPEPLIGMVVIRVLAQDEGGISRVYRVNGGNWEQNYKEFQLEQVVY